MQKKICIDCNKEFIPIKPDHTRCHRCWRIYDRKCLDCGADISTHPKNHLYCDHCFLTKHYKPDL